MPPTGGRGRPSFTSSPPSSSAPPYWKICTSGGTEYCERKAEVLMVCGISRMDPKPAMVVLVGKLKVTPVNIFQVLLGLAGSQSCTGNSVMFSSSINSESPALGL